MNEQIDRLIWKAGGFTKLDGSYSLPESHLEKLVELVVKECANVVAETHWHLPPTQQQISISIKEHFGVE